jgi:hypothetical protein
LRGLLCDSPAIGTGKNILAGSAYDQRGPLYSRTTGPANKVDVGAVQYDTIFADGYDGGP